MTETTTKIDIWDGKRSVSVRLPVAVATAFRAKASELRMTIGDAAKAAQREHNGTLAEAITRWVRDQMLYNTRESWIMKAVELFRPIFAERGHKLPDHIRATIAFTSRGWKGKARGECWNDSMSADGATEIMICLRESETVEIVNILCHELCHAAQFLRAKEIGKPIAKGAGHGKTFAVVAEALDLLPTEKEGKKGKRIVWDYALGDPNGAWGEWANEIIDALGPCPHAAIARAWQKKEAETPKQTTRMLKFMHEACPAAEDAGDYVWRASSKSVADKPHVFCPCCGERIDNPHYEGAGEVETDDAGDLPRKLVDTSKNDTRQVSQTVRSNDSYPAHSGTVKSTGRKSVVQDLLDEAAARSVIGRHPRGD